MVKAREGRIDAFGFLSVRFKAIVRSFERKTNKGEERLNTNRWWMDLCVGLQL